MNILYKLVINLGSAIARLRISREQSGPDTNQSTNHISSCSMVKTMLTSSSLWYDLKIFQWTGWRENRHRKPSIFPWRSWGFLAFRFQISHDDQPIEFGPFFHHFSRSKSLSPHFSMVSRSQVPVLRSISHSSGSAAALRVSKLSRPWRCRLSWRLRLRLKEPKTQDFRGI